MDAGQNKALVRRLVDDVVNGRNPDALATIAEAEFGETVRAWIGPFRLSFPDFRVEIIELLAEEERVAAHLSCSGTHRGDWDGHPPTGRQFLNVDEIYIFQVRSGRLTAATGIEDNLGRLQQLGLYGQDVSALGPPEQ